MSFSSEILTAGGKTSSNRFFAMVILAFILMFSVSMVLFAFIAYKVDVDQDIVNILKSVLSALVSLFAICISGGVVSKFSAVEGKLVDQNGTYGKPKDGTGPSE